MKKQIAYLQRLAVWLLLGCAGVGLSPAWANYDAAGFESIVDWSSSNATLSTTDAPVAQGQAALSVPMAGYVRVDSRELSIGSDIARPTAESGALLLDLHIPEGHQGWAGYLEVIFVIPEAGLWWEALGQQQLAGTAKGQYATHRFALTANLKAALASANALSLIIVVNAAADAEPWTLDHLRFDGQNQPEEPDEPAEPTEPTVVPSFDLGIANPYNGFFFQGFTATSSDVQGRLAAGANVSLNHYSIADQLSSAEVGNSLIVGGDLSFPSGRVYVGNVLVAGVDNVGDPVRNGMAPGTQIVANAELPVDFVAAEREALALSARLANLAANGTFNFQYGGLYLEGDGESDIQIFALSGEQVLNAHTFAVSGIPEGAHVLFNVDGNHTGLTNMSLESLSAHRERTLFNFHQATTLQLAGIGVEGSVLAPRAVIHQPQGVIRGTLVARSWDGPMQFNHHPFQPYAGSVSVIPPRFDSLPPTQVVHGEVYFYDADAESETSPPISYSLEHGPTGMSVGLMSGEMTWDTSGAQPGTHAAVLRATDAEGIFTDQSWEISLLPRQNAAPIAHPASRQLPEDSHLQLQLEGSDPDGDELTIRIVVWPQHGQLIEGADFWTYQPDSDFYGTDRFEFTVSDGVLESEAVAFELTIDPVNDQPQALAQLIETNQDSPAALVLSGVDIDGDPLSFHVVQMPQNGSLSGTGAQRTYTPNAGFRGADQFGFVANDGLEDSELTWVSIDVLAVNAVPSIVSQPGFEFFENETYSYQVEAHDPDDDALSFHLVRGPSGATLTEQGLLSWSPDGLGYTNGGLGSNAYCQELTADEAVVPDAVDTVVVVDASGSNMDSWPWISDAMAALHADLLLAGVGAAHQKNQYGYVGFTRYPEAAQFDNGIFGGIGDLYEATFEGKLPPGSAGGNENALAALQFAVDQYEYRANLPRNLIWIPDEEQQGFLANGEPLAGFQNRLQSGVFTVHAISFLYLTCQGDARSILGVDGTGKGYVDNPQGGFDICQVDLDGLYQRSESYTEGFVRPFFETAFQTGGAVWNILAIRDAARAGPLRKALTSRMYETTIGEGEGQPMPDLSIESFKAIGNAETATGEITVLNRGLAPYTGRLEFTVSENQFGQALVSGQQAIALDPGQRHIIEVPLASLKDFDSLRAELDAPDAEECVIENNALTVPVFVTRVTDGQGGAAHQVHTVTIQDVNAAPDITSTPPGSAYVGQLLRYSLQVSDVDVGDRHRFSMDVGSSIAQIDPSSGLFSFLPQPGSAAEVSFELKVTDVAGAVATQAFTLHISGDYQPPEYFAVDEPVGFVIGEGVAGYTPSIDADANAGLQFSLLEGPMGMVVDPFTGVVSWEAFGHDYHRVRLVILEVRDHLGNSDILTFTVYGDVPNEPPVIGTEPPESFPLLTNYTYVLNFSDPNFREEFELATANLIGTHSDWPVRPSGNNTYTGSFGYSSSHRTVSSPYRLEAADYLCESPAAGGTELAVALAAKWSVPGAVGDYPIAIPVRDSNGDGVVDQSDTASIVVTHPGGGIRALDGTNGQVQWERAFPLGHERLSRTVAPAAADINGDGSVDVLVVSEYERRLMALSTDDGRSLWTSAGAIMPSNLSRGQIVIDDFEADGQPEILAGFGVFNTEGQLLWQLSGSDGQGRGSIASPMYPMDLDGDGVKEVLHGGQVRNATGALQWELPLAPGGSGLLAYWAFGDLDADGDPELILAERGLGGDNQATLRALSHDGEIVWGPYALQFVGQPLVGDFAGDGLVEIFVPGQDALYSREGHELWRLDHVHGADGIMATAADLQGHGRVAIFLNRGSVRGVYDGMTGQLMSTYGGSSNQWAKPVLVDLDRDGRVEVINHYFSSVSVDTHINWDADESSLLTAHQLWSQSEALTAELAPNSAARASWAVQNSDQVAEPSRTLFTAGLPDLWLDMPRGDYSESIRVRVRNRGTADYLGAFDVALFLEDPASGAEPVQTQHFGGLQRGREVVATFAALESTFLGEVFAQIRPAAAISECQNNNNQSSAFSTQVTLTDRAGATVLQRFLLGRDYRVGPGTLSAAPSVSVDEMQEVQIQLATSSWDLATFDDTDASGFALSSAPRGMRINTRTGLIHWVPDRDQAGTYTVRAWLRFLSGQTASRSFVVTVQDVPNQSPTISSQPPQQILLSGASFTYQLEATDPDGDALTFSLPQSPEGMSIDTATGAISWVAGAVGSYPVEVAVSDGELQVSQSFELLVQQQNRAPQFASIPALVAYAGQTYSYTLDVPDPDGDALTTSLLTAPTGAALVSGGSQFQWLPEEADLGHHEVVLRAEDPSGAYAQQSFTLAVHRFDATNTAPTIYSTPSGFAPLGADYVYNIQAADAEADALRYLLQQGPAGMTVDSQTGELRWSPTAVSTHDVAVHVSDQRGGVATQRFSLVAAEPPAANHPPTILSQPVLRARQGFEYQYQLQVQDPDGDAVSYSLRQGPDGMSIDQAGLLQWEAPQGEVTTVAVSVSDGEGFMEQGWQLAVLSDAQPLVAGLEVSSAYVDEGETITVTANHSYAVGPLTRQLLLDGSPISLSEQGVAEIVTSGVGAHQLQLNIADAYQSAQAAVQFSVRDSSDTEPPQILLESVQSGDVLTVPTSIVASVSDSAMVTWRLILKERGSLPTEFRVLAEGAGNVDQQLLATFDPTLLVNGAYELILEATDANGQLAQTVAVVSVEGQLKLGMFSIGFEDMTVDASGIPVVLSRQYDSRQRHQSMDFGQGWSLGYQNLRIQESRAPGAGWRMVQYAQGSFTTYCIEPLGRPFVAVTLPDGRVEKFAPKATPECNTLSPVVDVQLGFEPIEGTTSTLESTDFGALRFYEDKIVDLGNPDVPVDPNLYRLTTADGFIYELDQGYGIRRMIEPTGHSLSFGDDGILHSGGRSITFERDSQGRIQRVEAPDGSSLQYTYDAAGNLIGVTDPLGRQSSFSYDSSHGLVDMRLPDGTRVLRNEYDADGRLLAQEDGEGGRMEFDHDIAGRQELARDRLGRTLVAVYDDWGNLISETNGAGETTTRTFDAQNNELSRTNALGHTTQWTYDDQRNMLTETNALGHTRSFTYDTQQRLLTEMGPDGILQSEHSYSPLGQLTRTVNAVGEETLFSYHAYSQGLTEVSDALGPLFGASYQGEDLIAQTDGNGVETRFSVDVLGRRLSETTLRTLADGSQRELLTQHAYDDKGQRTQTTDAMGQVSRVEYTVFGQPAAEIDPLGRRTEYQYNARGQKVLTVYPDGTTEAVGYDANGNEVSRTDRGGRTTRMVYDAADRLIETIYPDDTPGDDSDNPRSRTEYDAAGRVVAEVDAAGSRVEYTLDAIGQQVAVRDAAGHLRQYSYDARGNRILMRDALGRETQYVYDAADRLIETIHPDGSREQQAYDARGRRIHQTDANGYSTHYEYDGVGNLVAVEDALGQRTEYGYDEQGNKLRQTDAEGRSTVWAYDDLGRVSSRTLPLGHRESFAYDAVGNRTQRVDFNGALSTVAYDSSDRPTQHSYADGTVVSTSYTPSGQIDTVADARGTTTYSYDSRDRLISLTQPDGRNIDYAYDPVGNRIQLSAPSGDVHTSYDALHRINSVSDALTGTTYDPVGNATERRYSNGGIERTSYDSLNRPILIEHLDAQGQLIQRQAYTLGLAGHRTSITDLDGRRVEYGYDSLYRLTRERVTDATRGNTETLWTYDRVGNRLTQNECTPRCGQGGVEVLTSYSYDANDRLISENRSGHISSYSYDANGNTTQKATPEGATTYIYNSQDRLIQANTPTDSLSFSYDNNGIRQSKTVNGIRTEYLVDPNQAYAQVVAEYDDLGGLLVDYVFGEDLIRQDRGGTQSFYLYDALGSARGLADDAADLSDSYIYEAFGTLEQATGSTQNSYLFAGEQFDQDLELYYNRARYMDQATGRFTSMDRWMGVLIRPITLQKYLYGDASPINNIDPSGYQTLSGATIASTIRANLSTLSQASYSVTLRKVGNGLACVAVEEAVTQVVLGGIYILADGGDAYTGRTNKFERRYQEHLRDIRKNIKGTLARFQFSGNKNDLRLLEQFFMDFLDKERIAATNEKRAIAASGGSENTKSLRNKLKTIDFCKGT